MGAVALLGLYLLTSLALWGLLAVLRHRVTAGAAAVLTLLPLAFTAGGFLPGKVLAPTAMLTRVAPWVDPNLVARVEGESTPDNPLLLDPISEMLPWRRAAREQLLLNPAQGGGAALLGNGISAVLFPTEVAARLLPPARAATYSQAARLLLAAWGALLLLRVLGVGEEGAVVAALAFTGAGFLHLWRCHPQSLVAACAPWILAGAVELVRRPGPSTAVAAALAVSCGVLGGHHETLLHVLILGTLVTIPYLPGRGLKSRIGWTAAGAGLALLLSAPVLLPFAENLAVSAEMEARQGQLPDALEEPWPVVVKRLAPNLYLRALGDPIRGDFRGPDNLAELGGGAVGVAALALLPAALAGRRRKVAASWLALGLLGLLVAAHAPLVSRLPGALPLLRLTLLKRLSLWWALAASVGVGIGAEALCGKRGRWAFGVGAVVITAGLFLLPGAAEHPGEVALLGALPALAVAGGLGLPGAARTAVLATALLLPQAALLDRWIPLTSALGFYPEMTSVAFVREQLGSNPSGYRVSGLDAALVPHSAAFFGLEEPRAYDPMTFAPYQGFMGALGERDDGWTRIIDPTLPALDFLGVRYVFDHPSMTTRPGMRTAYVSRDALVDENPEAMPRLFVPATYRPVVGKGVALAMARRLEDFRNEAVVLNRRGDGRLVVNGRGVVVGLKVGGRGLEAEVRAQAPLLAVTSQPAIPGWWLLIDDRRRAPASVNGAFLGAWVTAGVHRLEFLYLPASWVLGAGLCGVGVALALGLTLSPAGWRSPSAVTFVHPST